MSSAPAVDGELRVTIKRVPGGSVSNHLIDTLSDGDLVEVTPPAGVFCLAGDGPLVAYAAGSGITPVFSLVKEALATTARPVRLLYATRDRPTTIFRADLGALAAAHPGRLEVEHHLDVDHGYVGADAVLRSLDGDADQAEVYVCGPGPFMDVVESTLLGSGVPERRIHIERFTPADEGLVAPAPAGESARAGLVTIEIGGRTETADHRPGTTILQVARELSLSPPYSCESGSCATCMARLVDGTVEMRVNDVLEDDEVADGWVLTCQSVPTSPSVKVVYEDD
jgi:ferredoxin-NADP reductase